MPDILIRGMEMPSEGGAIGIYKISGNFYAARVGKDELFPLLELPPHGDLIDRREIISDLDTAKQHPDFNGWDSYADGFARAFIETATIIVPAEKGE